MTLGIVSDVAPVNVLQGLPIQELIDDQAMTCGDEDWFVSANRSVQVPRFCPLNEATHRAAC